MDICDCDVPCCSMIACLARENQMLPCAVYITKSGVHTRESKGAILIAVAQVDSKFDRAVPDLAEGAEGVSNLGPATPTLDEDKA